ncbi:hypothetical protein EON81_25135 [bacterium]|nr:MAG: hypothetical protein EON81_25135 [bacterium]
MLIPALLLLSEPKIYEPKVGSPERKALMDALRKVTTPGLRQSVVFKVDWLRSNGSAAFFYGRPVQPNGKPVDYTKTIYADAKREGVFDDNAHALWRKRGKKWIVDDWGIGNTDVPWDGMWTRKGLPRGLFPKAGG